MEEFGLVVLKLNGTLLGLRGCTQKRWAFRRKMVGLDVSVLINKFFWLLSRVLSNGGIERISFN